MVKEAEENAESDKILKAKVEAKNQLESYLYSLRSSVEDTLKDKIEESDKVALSGAVKDGLSWLEDHPSDEAEAYETKRKEIETIANPIIAKAYATSPDSNSQQPSEDNSSKASSNNEGPTVEEVD